MMTETAQILDGKATSKSLLEKVRLEIESLKGGHKPKLVVILVGENPASEVYVASKVKTANQLGVDSELHRFPEDIPQHELIQHLVSLNQDETVNAVLVQLPLPRHIQTELILETVSPHKDVDGFHPENMGKLVLGIEPPALPCTPAGIIHLLDAYHIKLEGLRAAVVGRSNIVGKPITLMLTHRNVTVTLCHTKTRDLDAILKDSDLIIAAAGKAGLIRADAIKPGAIIIDVGINRLPDGKLTGDVDFEAVKGRAGYITPVPGGVGPMTIAMLMLNTVRLFKFQQGQRPESLLFV
jgi:methylenetetrahydrofolate dehydrogenase (NADP+) / methenyltetrahydrofolate cyclohydrolase